MDNQPSTPPRSTTWRHKKKNKHRELLKTPPRILFGVKRKKKEQTGRKHGGEGRLIFAEPASPPPSG